MTRHVFISHSSDDKAEANRLCRALEARNLRCWIAPRDIPAAASWPAAIADAIRTAGAMIVVFSARSERSRPTQKEVVLANSCRIEIIPARIEDVDPTTGVFPYVFADSQREDLFADWDGAVERIATHLARILASDDAEHGAQHVPQSLLSAAARGAGGFRSWQPRSLRTLVAGGCVATVLLLGGLAAAVTDLPNRLTHMFDADAQRTEDRKAWRTAEAVDTVEAYGGYRKAFPRGLHVEDALRREAELKSAALARADWDAWRSAMQAGTLAAINDYLKTFPAGRYVGDATEHAKRIGEQEAALQKDRDAWTVAQAANSIGSYQEYLRFFPLGLSVGEAQRRLVELAGAARQKELAAQQEADAWHAASTRDSIKAYTDYLVAWPTGSNAEQAKQRLDELEKKEVARQAAREADDDRWSIATKINTRKAYEEYIAASPEGLYLAAAREAIDKLPVTRTPVAKSAAQRSFEHDCPAAGTTFTYHPSNYRAVSLGRSGAQLVCAVADANKPQDRIERVGVMFLYPSQSFPEWASAMQELMREVWPLAPGKEAEKTFSGTAPLGRGVNGTWRYHVKVGDVSRVEVPAGKFEAIGVRVTIERLDQAAPTVRNTFAYAPEIRWAVRYESRDMSGGKVLEAWEVAEISRP